MGAEIKKVISQALMTKIALLKINGPPIKNMPLQPQKAGRSSKVKQNKIYEDSIFGANLENLPLIHI